MNFICHIPLASGFALGNMNIIHKPPVAITSYTPFESNDNLLRRYISQKRYNVPYYQLDKLDKNHLRFISEKYGPIDFVSAVPLCNALSQAATKFCKEHNFKYKLTECAKQLSYEEIKQLIDKNELIFMKRYQEKFNNYINNLK